MKQSIRILLAAASLGAAALAHAEVAVIINAGSSAMLSESDVANIFLGKSKSLKGVDQKDWSPTKEKFYAAVTNKNEAQLKSYWSGLVFTGKGQPLPSVASDAEVVAKVAAEADAIGYVDEASVTNQVRVLHTFP
ncbi:phosphate ABC transporter substrate-binding protein [Pseudomonas stutzeri]|uniref:phosphate ABC transporter substrate-binding protein n=1 Tax=Stutzerimonas stutzeri TaxID=316 RepID=UPI00210A7AF6|nr:phosphate ABC transporter substrate-binding protein [Stutzerimonas stutzeri]MCQ4312776.1 phosphate ABC transporter substrate-binding protein [Stutzerimonas stutzeri]